MKILITGTKGLATALHDVYADHHSVTMVSRRTGHCLANVESWGLQFLDYDMVFNNAYHDFDQISVLQFFYKHWINDRTKTIINIGSRSICYPRSDQSTNYWPYRIHKQALQQVYDSMQPLAQCRLKMFNPGPIDTDMVKHINVPKLSTQELAQRISQWVDDPFIRRVDCWI